MKLVEDGAGPVWAYDTFDGVFPVHTAVDGESRDILGQIGQYCTAEVKRRLEEIGVFCVEGVFPATFHASHPDTVSFVHVDMDTYVATKAALELFHPLMIEDGVFMIHDYDNWGLPGVRRAADEFAAGPQGAEYECSFDAGHHKMRKRSSVGQ